MQMPQFEPSMKSTSQTSSGWCLSILLAVVGLLSMAPTAVFGQSLDLETEINGAAQDESFPYAYALGSNCVPAKELAMRSGWKIEVLREDVTVEVRQFDLHNFRQSDAGKWIWDVMGPEFVQERLAAGSWIIRGNEKQTGLKALSPATSSAWLASWLNEQKPSDSIRFPVSEVRFDVGLLTSPLESKPSEPGKEKLPITYETLYGKKRRPSLTPSPSQILGWSKSGDFYYQSRSGKRWEVETETGAPIRVITNDPSQDALSASPWMDERTASRFGLPESGEAEAKVFSFENDLYFVQANGEQAIRLTSNPAVEELAEISPNGQKVAFVRNNNLYVVDVTTGIERALTLDGDTENGVIRNGKADWVYFEELYSRNWKAFWWSPDSSKLVFLQFDDSRLQDYPLVNFLPLHARLEKAKYPKAGDPNPVAKVGIVSSLGGDVDWVDLRPGYVDGTVLIPRVGWFPNSRHLYLSIQNREQTWLDFWTFNDRGSSGSKRFRETTEAWVEDLGAPIFLDSTNQSQDSARFLWFSERTGWRHLYETSLNWNKTATESEKEISWKAVTKGDWEVRGLHGVDEAGGWVYVSGTKDSHIAEHTYRVSLTTGETVGLTTDHRGRHQVTVDPSFRYMVDTWSSHEGPGTTRLLRTDGSLVRMIDTNPVPDINAYQWGNSILFQIPAEDGFLYEAQLTFPVNCDPDQSWPLWLKTYGGPHAPTIRDQWSFTRIEDQALANLGMLVLRFDPRSASGKGAVSAWNAYRQMGGQELADVEEGLRWVMNQYPVDPSRIGMNGHSFGGFLTAYAMTHSKMFSAGIAGAPVTDWRFYDSVYTERYMGIPQENLYGYEKTSVVKAAKDLHGRLMILHGMLDDNVHPQNTLAFVDALQAADRDFELMIYPDNRHGIYGGHVRRLIWKFIAESFGLNAALLQVSSP